MPPGRPKGSTNKKKPRLLLSGQTKLQFPKLQYLAPKQLMKPSILSASGRGSQNAPLSNNRSSNEYEGTSAFPHPLNLGLKRGSCLEFSVPRFEPLSKSIVVPMRTRTLENQFAFCGVQLEEECTVLQQQCTALAMKCGAYDQARELACSKVTKLNGVGSPSQTAALKDYQVSLRKQCNFNKAIPSFKSAVYLSVEPHHSICICCSY